MTFRAIYPDKGFLDRIGLIALIIIKCGKITMGGRGGQVCGVAGAES